ncbi:MAG: hypothetical protein IPJ13_01490 [Saprospiraceae bacterium]|nr:hypothetical protein [Saprospiraceae bacterium]
MGSRCRIKSKSITDSTPISVYKSDKTFISPDPGHSHDEIMTQLDGGLGHTNDGFVHSFTLKKGTQRRCARA